MSDAGAYACGQRCISVCRDRDAARKSRRRAFSRSGRGGKCGNVDADRRCVVRRAGGRAARPNRRCESGNDEQRCDGAPRRGGTLGLLRNDRRWDRRSCRGPRRVGCAFAYDQHAEHADRKSRNALPVADQALRVAARVRRCRTIRRRRRHRSCVRVPRKRIGDVVDGATHARTVGTRGRRPG